MNKRMTIAVKVINSLKEGTKPTKEIVSTEDLNYTHTIVSALASSGLLLTTRGRNGGLTLPDRQVTMGDVARVFSAKSYQKSDIVARMVDSLDSIVLHSPKLEE